MDEYAATIYRNRLQDSEGMRRAPAELWEVTNTVVSRWTLASSSGGAFPV